jgi:3-oxoadipate enol-lactonase
MLQIGTHGDLAVNVVRAGPRGLPPVLFMHAVGLDLTWWDQQFAAFGDTHDLIAFDMPGHGLSDPFEGPPSFARLASVAAEVLDRLQAGPAHVVGVSVGGMIAQTLSLERPDLVRSLTLVATLCSFPQEVRAALRERARVAREEGMAVIAPLTLDRWFPPDFRAQRPDVLDRAAKSLLRHDQRVHAAMWDMIAGLELEARLPAIGCRTLVVAGEEDVNAPVAAGRRIAAAIPGAAFHALAGAGHFPPVERPAEFNALLGGFLERRE